MAIVKKLTCIHELPADYADMVDEDLLCPVVIGSLSIWKKDSWTTPKWKVSEHVYVDLEAPPTPDPGYEHPEPGYEHRVGKRLPYSKVYGFLSYYIVADEDEITVDCIGKYIDELNTHRNKWIMEIARGNYDIVFEHYPERWMGWNEQFKM